RGIAREIGSARNGLETFDQLNGPGEVVIVFGVPTIDARVHDGHVQIGHGTGGLQGVQPIFHHMLVGYLVSMPRRGIGAQAVLPIIGDPTVFLCHVPGVGLEQFYILLEFLGIQLGGAGRTNSTLGRLHMATLLKKGVDPTGRGGISRFSQAQPKRSRAACFMESDTALGVCVSFIPSVAARARAVAETASPISRPAARSLATWPPDWIRLSKCSSSRSWKYSASKGNKAVKMVFDTPAITAASEG